MRLVDVPELGPEVEERSVHLTQTPFQITLLGEFFARLTGCVHDPSFSMYWLKYLHIKYMLFYVGNFIC